MFLLPALFPLPPAVVAVASAHSPLFLFHFLILGTQFFSHVFSNFFEHQ